MLCKNCDHELTDHHIGLFGTICCGKDWFDDYTFACKCEKFEPNERNNTATP